MACVTLHTPTQAEYRKYKTTFPVAPPPAPSSTRLSLAPPDAALTPRRAAGRVPCQQHAGRRTADAPVRPGAGCQAAARGPPLCDAPTLGARQREVRPAGRDGFQRAYSEPPARSETDATRWHTRRRVADWPLHPSMLHRPWEKLHAEPSVTPSSITAGALCLSRPHSSSCTAPPLRIAKGQGCDDRASLHAVSEMERLRKEDIGNVSNQDLQG